YAHGCEVIAGLSSDLSEAPTNIDRGAADGHGSHDAIGLGIRALLRGGLFVQRGEPRAPLAPKAGKGAACVDARGTCGDTEDKIIHLGVPVSGDAVGEI